MLQVIEGRELGLWDIHPESTFPEKVSGYIFLDRTLSEGERVISEINFFKRGEIYYMKIKKESYDIPQIEIILGKDQETAREIVYGHAKYITEEYKNVTGKSLEDNTAIFERLYHK